MERTYLFSARTEGSFMHRIPAVVVSPRGTALAFCEARRRDGRDDDDIDIVVKRRDPATGVWGWPKIVYDKGADCRDTIGNPCPVIDAATGDVVLLFCRNNHQAYVTRSADDGLTWSTPVEITEIFHGFDFRVVRVATGPLHGLRMTGGRLVIPVWLSDGEHRQAGPRSYRSAVLLSDDGGRTWRRGGLTQATVKDMNECAVAETSTGGIYLSARAQEAGFRAVCWSSDGGETWSAPQLDRALPDATCQGSALSLPAGGRPSRLLFTNIPNSDLSVQLGQRRRNLSLRVSADDGRTWSAPMVIHASRSGYSDLCSLPNGDLGVFYEGGAEGERSCEQLIFATMTAAEVQSWMAPT